MENLENNESANIIEQLERIRTATILAYFKRKDLDDWMLYNSVPACYAAATPARVRAKSFAY